jgi:hypothetical protein
VWIGSFLPSTAPFTSGEEVIGLFDVQDRRYDVTVHQPAHCIA